MLLFLVLIVACLTGRTSVARGAEVTEKYDDGKLKLHYRTDGQDRKTGPYEEFFPNGKTKVRGQFTAGKKSGQWSTYNEAGKVLESAGYRNDLLEGPYSWSLPSGKPAMRGQYRSGRLYGSATTLDEKGSIVRRISYPRPRDMVEKVYNTLYYTELPATKFTTAPTWNPIYKAGVLSPETLEAGLKVTKLYRYLSGVSWETLSIDSDLCDLSAHGAVLLARLGDLTHTPQKPADMDAAFFKRAYRGCNEANLDMTDGNPVTAVRSFMNDSDESNVSRIGHRQWVLSPGLQHIGFGSAGDVVSMHVLAGGESKFDYNFIAFPGEGFYPRSLIESSFAWSLFLNHAKSKLGDSLKITLQKLDAHYQSEGEPIPAKVIATPTEDFGGAGWNVIVFKPELASLDLARYWVGVEGIQTVAGTDAPFGYLVEFIDVPPGEKDPALARSKPPAASPKKAN
jgi:antitoxin component YwqK of YwqJK toxin-antitoxin module